MKWLVSICLTCFSMIALAQAPISTGFFSNKALDGYDTVAEASPQNFDIDHNVSVIRERSWLLAINNFAKNNSPPEP